ncbi:MAG: glycoside hydrolase family 2 protein [Cellulomonadaceae bacterium]|nr:glycoside hydrolase family 2 protein [Cellulomonadaceae bacterium]
MSPRLVRREPLTAWHLALATPEIAPPAARHAVEGGFAARVPGSVLGTLVAAGLVPDVTVDGTEEQVAWPSAGTWSYHASVPRSGSGDRVRLVFEGIDTVATIRVDGRAVCEPDDMFHRWEVDLGVDDEPGQWEVDVELRPALPVASAAEAAHPLPRSDSYELPYNQIRKMACSFGWDWGPTTLTCGLWRPVVVERSRGARLTQLLLTPDWEGHAILRGEVTIDGDASAVRVRVVGLGCDAAPLVDLVVQLDRGVARLDLTVPEALPWDVAGYGDQALYVAVVEVLDAKDEVVDVARRQVGFRRVEVRTVADDDGRSFAIIVNGTRVWARGFNWIPPHVLPEAVTRDRVRALVSQAAQTGAVMLRVWGGGVVESEDFYDVCDELGMLVWQDSSFACAAYAEDEAQVARVRREVRDAVVRVGHRASLAVWCGNNENLWGYEDWGWKDRLGDRPWGSGLYHQVIPDELANLDPTRPYVPGSPFSPDPGHHPNDPGQGTTHHWDTWNDIDYTAFEIKRSRFASEFGWQAPATWPTLIDAIGGEPTGADDPRLERLQKAAGGMAKLARGVTEHLPQLPTDIHGWYLATQLVQARALRAAIGRFRSLHDSCSGALWWQLDDCWPALSWSVVDVAGRRKLAWWAAAEVMAPRAILPTAHSDPGGLTLVNDTSSSWRATGALRVLSAAGDVLQSRHVEVDVASDGHAVLSPGALPPSAAGVMADVDGRRAVRWLGPDHELPVRAARVRVRIDRAAPAVVRIEVEALDLVRDLVLLAEIHPRLRDSQVDHQLIQLIPGEVAVFGVTAAGAASLADLAWFGLLKAGTPLEIA